MDGEKRSVIREAWRLAAPYWRSEDWRYAWALLIAVTALNLANVYVDVRYNQWNRDFYNALQEKNLHEFFWQCGIFVVIGLAFVAISVYALYLNQMLQIRWRRWLTERYVTQYLSNRTYFRIQLEGRETDNPDQRIQDDLRLFTDFVLSLSLGLLSSVVSLISFSFILWRLSGPADVPLFGWGTVHVPAYLVWCALLYAIVGTWLTVKIGRPLVPLNFSQQRLEADFRFSLVRFRENAESIAFYRGEGPERDVFRVRFGAVFDNFWQIMKRRKRLNWFTSFYGQAAVIFPYLVAGPRYFAGQTQLGDLMQVGDAFGSVQSSLSFIINSYYDISQWSAVTQRLSTFERHMTEFAEQSRAPQTVEIHDAGAGVEVKSLDIDLPDRSPLLRGVSFAVPAGGALLVTGPTGVGKSTVMRAIAGLWHWGKGEVRLGAGVHLFLPQKPYLPLGTLADTLAYPASAEANDPRLKPALEAVGLGDFVPSLGVTHQWMHRMSLGEQQRLAFARVLLVKPAVVFLDEATSALDEAAEDQLYHLLREAPWHPTLVSVGHRSSLVHLHDQMLDIGRFAARRHEIASAAD